MKLKDRVSLAALHMKEANVGLAAKSLFGSSLTINSGTYRGLPEQNGDDVFYPMDTGYGSHHFSAIGCIDYVKAYFLCPSLSAIINRKAQAYTNGKTWVLNTSGKAKGQEATGETAIKLRKLMAQPNKLQTWKQFEAQNYIYTQLFGFCVVLIQKPVGFPNVDATALWNIPPHILTITEKQGMFYKGNAEGVESIVVSYGNERATLPLDRVFIFRDIMPSFCTMFFPDSRVKTLEMPINNIIGAYESRNMLINSRGSLGMITNETKDAFSALPLKPGEKEDLLSEFKRLYGLRSGQSHVIISSAALKWQSMVMPTKDLMLFEEIEDDNNRICDAYMFPPELLARMNKGTTFSNMQTATRNLYQDAIVPEAGSNYEQWNKLFDTASYNLIIDRDYTHLAALQPDAKAEAEARLRRNQALQIEFRNDVITLNQWRIMNGDDPKPGDDVYYSEIKDRFTTTYQNGQSPTSVEETFVEDNLNPRQNAGDAANINEDGSK